MKSTKNKIIASILTITLAVTIVPNMHNIAGKEAKRNNEISYKFANDNPGSAYGTITFASDEAGEYSFYWGDSEGQKLKYNGTEYSELGKSTTTSDNLTATYKIISPYTAIPEGAKELQVYNANDEKISSYDIPESKQFAGGQMLYKFGIMGDVHYNRYSDFSEDDAVPAFNDALKFMDNQGIDFVGMTGDLSNTGEENAYTKFNTAINQYPNMTVYTCMGNHDLSTEKFLKTVNIKKNSDKNVREINDNGLDFVYEKNGDIFIIFNQVHRSYNSKTGSLVDREQLNWLEKTLNTYAGKNVYIFFHTYFAKENGDVITAVGNLQNPGGYKYPLTYTFGNYDENRFRQLLNKYPNVTLFSGHSHWAYDQQKYNPNLNIGNIKDDNSGATLVHISSVGAARTIEPEAAERVENNGIKSEGMVAFKYNNATVYTGVDLKNGKYLAYATYLNYDGKKSVPIPAVKVAKTKIKSVKNLKKLSKKSKKYKVTITYKKIKDAAGYKIKYSTSRQFNKVKTKSSKKAKYTLTKLKAKTYYVKVCAYKEQFGYEVYGKWSNVKKIKIKKIISKRKSKKAKKGKKQS